jgi:hypothetical protein
LLEILNPRKPAEDTRGPFQWRTEMSPQSPRPVVGLSAKRPMFLSAPEPRGPSTSMTADQPPSTPTAHLSTCFLARRTRAQDHR